MIVAFLPAAGASRRMKGRDKLLEPVDGRPLLRRAAETALSAGLGPVLAGLRPDDAARRHALDDLAVGIVEVPNAGTGMSATLRAGAGAALAAIGAGRERNDACDGMLVFLPDMPEIEAPDLVEMARVFETHGGPVVRATTRDGRPGLPVLFPRTLLHAFDRLDGDRGAAALLEDQRVVDLALPGERALTDLDTPGDWARWRATHGRSSS